MRRPIARIKAIYSDASNFEIREPLLVGDREWSVRIGVSTLLIGDQLSTAFRQAISVTVEGRQRYVLRRMLEDIGV